MVFNIVFICENNDRLIFAAESIGGVFSPANFLTSIRENHAMINLDLERERADMDFVARIEKEERLRRARTKSAVLVTKRDVRMKDLSYGNTNQGMVMVMGGKSYKIQSQI